MRQSVSDDKPGSNVKIIVQLTADKTAKYEGSEDVGRYLLLRAFLSFAIGDVCVYHIHRYTP